MRAFVLHRSVQGWDGGAGGGDLDGLKPLTAIAAGGDSVCS